MRRTLFRFMQAQSFDAVEDAIWLANQIYDKALLRLGQGNIDFKW
jgi:hypothetical protein